jgi:UDP-glucose 4,6-dehydratase
MKEASMSIVHFKPQCVLITGIAGFIASNVAIDLVIKYPEIQFIGLDKLSYCSNVENFAPIANAKNYTFYPFDLMSESQVSEVFATHSIDTVMHFAAYTHVDRSFGNSIEFTRNNVLGTHILLEHAKQNNIKRFIHVSTDECYGSKDTISSEESTLDPTNPYAATKAAAEHLVKSYHHSFKLPIIISRGNNVYGPRQYPEKVIPLFIQRVLAHEKCQIHGRGTQKRSFLYVDDVSRAFEVLLFEGIIGEIYNIGSEEEYTVLDVAERILAKLKPGSTAVDWIEYVEDRQFNDQRYFISSAKLQALGWKQQISFEEGLAKTIVWYTTNCP